MLDGVSEELGPLQDCLAEMLTGGKRLRPAFAYWGYRGAGGADSDALVRAAASLELFQACALIHDDLMDGSDTRRGPARRAPAVRRACTAPSPGAGTRRPSAPARRSCSATSA